MTELGGRLVARLDTKNASRGIFSNQIRNFRIRSKPPKYRVFARTREVQTSTRPRRYHEAPTSLPASSSTPPVTPRRVLQPRPRTAPPHNARPRDAAPFAPCRAPPLCVWLSWSLISAPLHVAVSRKPRLIPPRLEAALISVRSRREARRCPRSLRQRGRGRHQAAVRRFTCVRCGAYLSEVDTRGAAVSAFTETERPRAPPSGGSAVYLRAMCSLYLECTP